MQENALDELEDLMNQVFARKAESVPGIAYVRAYYHTRNGAHVPAIEPLHSACRPELR